MYNDLYELIRWMWQNIQIINKMLETIYYYYQIFFFWRGIYYHLFDLNNKLKDEIGGWKIYVLVM